MGGVAASPAEPAGVAMRSASSSTAFTAIGLAEPCATLRVYALQYYWGMEPWPAASGHTALRSATARISASSSGVAALGLADCSARLVSHLMYIFCTVHKIR
jgi:hypothetical protein